MPTMPRVFISYARSDGLRFARKLRDRLEAEHIPLFQDVVSLVGGEDFLLQIYKAIDQVEFLASFCHETQKIASNQAPGKV
jgi:TIR domain